MILQRSRLIVQYCKSQGIERETSPSIFFMCYSKTCFYSSFLLGFGSSTVKLAEKVYGKIGGKKDLWLGLTVSYFFKLREIRSCTKQVTVSPSFDRFAKLKENTKLGKKSVSKQCFVSYFCIFSFKLCTFSSSFVLSIRHTHPLLLTLTHRLEVLWMPNWLHTLVPNLMRLFLQTNTLIQQAFPLYPLILEVIRTLVLHRYENAFIY